MDDVYVVDCEGDGLVPTKFWCLSYTKLGTKEIVSITDYEAMRAFLLQDATFIMHNGIGWDIPNLERVLGIEIKATIIDSLFVSWYLYPERQIHGLEGWGEDFGVPKPKIDNWEDLSLEEYVTRCNEDVKINLKLWNKQAKYLSVLYETEDVLSLPILSYLSFKAKCAQLAAKSKWKIDRHLCTSTLSSLYEVRDEKIEGLSKVMPPVKKYRMKGPPAKPYKKDGSLSTHGSQWQHLLRKHNLPEDYKGEVPILVAEEPPNPASHVQIKDWLFSLGWEPATFKYEREEDGSNREIPQVRTKDKLLCPSVLLLADKEPAIHLLDGLSVAQHRISILEGFLNSADEDDFVKAEIQGLTNTLRFKHKTIVNLPGVDKPYGKEIRGALKARRQDMELCGSDMSSLENLTGDHYISIYDPKYVEDKNTPGYDPHIEMCVMSGLLNEKEAAFFKAHKDDHLEGDDAKKLRSIKVQRHKGKTTVYSATYGVGKDKLARELGVPVKEAQSLLEAFWKRNWAIKAASGDFKVKTVGKQMWIYNPVSKFWYSLRYDKDRWSTINQSTGVYCFDTWVSYIMSKRPQINGQFHDEVVLEIKKGHREDCTNLLRWAIDKTNEKLKLNVKLDISIQYGDTYGEIH